MSLGDNDSAKSFFDGVQSIGKDLKEAKAAAEQEAAEQVDKLAADRSVNPRVAVLLFRIMGQVERELKDRAKAEQYFGFISVPAYLKDVPVSPEEAGQALLIAAQATG